MSVNYLALPSPVGPVRVCLAASFDDCWLVSGFLPSTNSTPANNASSNVAITASATSYRTDLRKVTLANRLFEESGQFDIPNCAAIGRLGSSRSPESWTVDLCMRFPTNLLSRTTLLDFRLGGGPAAAEAACASPASANFFCPRESVETPSGGVGSPVFETSTTLVVGGIDARAAAPMCVLWDESRRLWLTRGAFVLGFSFNGSAVAVKCRREVVSANASTPARARRQLAASGALSQRSMVVAIAASPYNEEFSSPPLEQAASRLVVQHGRLSSTSRVSGWMAIGAIVAAFSLVVAVVADILLWGPSPCAVCRRNAKRLPPLLFWVGRNATTCCGSNKKVGDGLRRRGRGTIGALAHNFLNYGTLSRDPAAAANEDIDEEMRLLEPRRVLPFVRPTNPKGYHQESGLRLQTVHAPVTVPMETRMPLAFTLEEIRFRNRSPEAVAAFGPGGKLERRYQIKSLLLKSGQRIPQSALTLAQSGAPGVSPVVPGAGQAQLKGLRVGDIIHAINGETFAPVDEHQALTAHQAKQRQLQMHAQVNMMTSLFRGVLKEKIRQVETLDHRITQETERRRTLLSLVSDPLKARRWAVDKRDEQLEELDGKIQEAQAENDALRAQLKAGRRRRPRRSSPSVDDVESSRTSRIQLRRNQRRRAAAAAAAAQTANANSGRSLGWEERLSEVVKSVEVFDLEVLRPVTAEVRLQPPTNYGEEEDSSLMLAVRLVLRRCCRFQSLSLCVVVSVGGRGRLGRYLRLRGFRRYRWNFPAI